MTISKKVGSILNKEETISISIEQQHFIFIKKQHNDWKTGNIYEHYFMLSFKK